MSEKTQTWRYEGGGPLTELKDVVVLTIPSEDGHDINQNSSTEEILACPALRTYGLGDYFQAQNDEELPLHWSFLYDGKNNTNLTGADKL